MQVLTNNDITMISGAGNEVTQDLNTAIGIGAATSLFTGVGSAVLSHFPEYTEAALVCGMISMQITPLALVGATVVGLNAYTDGAVLSGLNKYLRKS